MKTTTNLIFDSQLSRLITLTMRYQFLSYMPLFGNAKASVFTEIPKSYYKKVTDVPVFNVCEVYNP